jgi:hypothetical protein
VVGLRDDLGVETLTLVLTDVEVSTRFWADEPDADPTMGRHYEIVYAAVT